MSNNQRIPDDVREQMYRYFLQAGHVRRTAAQFNVNACTISRLVKQWRSEGRVMPERNYGAANPFPSIDSVPIPVPVHPKSCQPPPPPPPPPVDPIKEAEERETKRRELARERELLKDVGGEKSFRAFLEQMFQEVMSDRALPPPPKPPQVKVRKSGTGPKQRYAILHLSDWHWGEIVESESVLGFNAYNAEITNRRAYRVIRAFIDLIDNYEASGRFVVPEVVVALNGDFVTGTIHGLERKTDARNIVEATEQCGYLLGNVFYDLCARFQKVRAYGTVGNHGRLPDDKRTPTKDPTRSWDYMVYTLAKLYMRAATNLEFHRAHSYAAFYQVGNHNVFQGHGDQIKQQLSTIGYGLKRTVGTLGTTFARVGKPLALALFGHWHATMIGTINGVGVRVNPSLIGTSEYGLHQYGEINIPCQDVYFLDDDHPPLGSEHLYAEGPGYDGMYELPT